MTLRSKLGWQRLSSSRVNKPSVTADAAALSQVEVVLDLQSTNSAQFRRLLWDLQLGL
jgi:hypothetical protein